MAEFQMTDEQIAQFHEDGYVIARQLFNEEEIGLLYKIAKADREMETAPGRKDAEGNTSRIRLRNELYDDIYSACVRSNRVARSMERLLGDEIYHFHHKMMLKEPRVGGAWEWHQDYGYWYKNNHCLWPDMASCAIAVDRATQENGCMQLLKGSHKCGRLEHGTTGEQTGAHMEHVEALKERLELIYAELEPGDALFFHSNTLHRSDANRSEHPRWTLICCYNTKHNSPYKERQGGHPGYHKLDIISDDQILEIGRRQWEQMQAQAV